MYQISFQEPCRIHFIGIGGISMSGLAEILLGHGFYVSGSDIKESSLTKRLESLGALVSIGQKPENIPEGTDVAVYTAAVHPDNPEFRGALQKGIPMLTRAELLGQIMRHYKNAINIAGTHGKTTTTSLFSEILIEAGLDPTVTVGGILPSIGGNVRAGGSDYFVVEACEYTNSFLSFFPTAEIILNIEADHLDFFRNIDDIRHSFRKFMELLPENGILVINGDIRALDELTEGLSCRIITVGKEASCDYRAADVCYDHFAHPTFTVTDKEGSALGKVTLRIPGEHNVYNALAAIAMAREYGISMDHICTGVARFEGTDRRFEHKGTVQGFSIIDDYAHHPQEIAATLKAARNCPHEKLWCIFQSHTYTRTKAFLKDFAASLSLADEVVLAPIYAARETDDLGISSGDIRRELEILGTPARCFDTFGEIEEFILSNAKPGDIVITMGAGDVTEIGDDLLSRR